MSVKYKTTGLVALVLAAVLAASCWPSRKTPAVEMLTGYSEPDLGWLFLEKGPYTLTTKVNAAPGPADIVLVKDLSLMAATPEIVFTGQADIEADSTLTIRLGQLEPGFYQVRLRDSVRWNIGIRPDAVVSAPDFQPDFRAFWSQTLAQMDTIPLEPVFTEIPEYSNEVRTCYEVSYLSWGRAISGGILSVPVAEGKYPVYVQYMGYGAEPYYFDPSASPNRIDYLVSVRDQGIFRDTLARWIDRGLAAKETFYYRGAFADAKRAVDFAARLDKADADHIVALGESQGGALTFVAAALDSRIKAIAPSVPFLGDYPDYAKIVHWPVHEVFEQADAEGLGRDSLMTMLTYFDVKNFAPLINCPTYMSFGLQDPTCPPHTNFAIYNNLGTREKRYFCVPTCGHAMWKEPAWDAERAAFLKQF